MSYPYSSGMQNPQSSYGAVTYSSGAPQYSTSYSYGDAPPANMSAPSYGYSDLPVSVAGGPYSSASGGPVSYAYGDFPSSSTGGVSYSVGGVGLGQQGTYSYSDAPTYSTAYSGAIPYGASSSYAPAPQPTYGASNSYVPSAPQAYGYGAPPPAPEYSFTPNYQTGQMTPAYPGGPMPPSTSFAATMPGPSPYYQGGAPSYVPAPMPSTGSFVPPAVGQTGSFVPPASSSFTMNMPTTGSFIQPVGMGGSFATPGYPKFQFFAEPKNSANASGPFANASSGPSSKPEGSTGQRPAPASNSGKPGQNSKPSVPSTGPIVRPPVRPGQNGAGVSKTSSTVQTKPKKKKKACCGLC